MPAFTAIAHSNIALIKYWGKRQQEGNLPAVGSISLTLDGLQTTTTVITDRGDDKDEIVLPTMDGNGAAKESAIKRVESFIHFLRRETSSQGAVHINSANNFPAGAGLASSASSFAALTHAFAVAHDVGADREQLSRWARVGSGSACRSLYGGFVEWYKGQKEDGSDSFATPLASPESWPLKIVVAVTDESHKKIGSTIGMTQSATESPYYDAWVEGQEADLKVAREAILCQDFYALAKVSEYSFLKMHAVMLASVTPLIYWNGVTLEIIKEIKGWREAGLPVFTTVDAGPQVKAVCLPEAEEEVALKLAALPGVLRVFRCGLGCGSYIDKRSR